MASSWISEWAIAVALLIVSVVATAFRVFGRGQVQNTAGVCEKSPQCMSSYEAKKSYNKVEVAQHNKRTDCWIIIKDKVYDVTSYVEEHPGGDAILAHAGDDSTDGFFGPQHATRVFDMVDEFYIGDLVH